MSDHSARTLFQCLAALAQHHRLPVDPEQALAEYAAQSPAPSGSHAVETLAVRLGLTITAAVLSWTELVALSADRLPLIACLNNGNHVLILGTRHASQVAVLDPLLPQLGVFWLEHSVFSTRWAGAVLFAAPRPARSAQEILIEALTKQDEGRIDEATRLFHEALALEPRHPAPWYSLAVIALHGGQPAEALRWAEAGLAAVPAFAPLHFARGMALQALDRREEALASFDAALAINPDFIEVLINSGVLLRYLARHHEALERTLRALAIAPHHPSALANAATLLSEFERHEEASALFERLMNVAPDHPYVLGLWFYERLHLCDWRDYEATVAQIIAGVRAGQRVCKTLSFMALTDDPADQYRAARIFAADYPRQPVSLWQGERYGHRKIRLGYVSPDLREHPVGQLLARVIEHHDKSRFETIAISLGANDGSALHARLRAAFDQFIDAQFMTSRALAEHIRALEIDLLIDLAGYTSDTRLDLFAYRPAPVQATFLGYPGTLSVDYMDCLIADRWVIPPEHQRYYRERIVYLPEAYLPLDDQLAPAASLPSRADYDLPENGFVFCAFSHDYKITPTMFALWMRLLAGVPGSVLWLVARNEATKVNLRREAERHGIAAERLVFTQRIPRLEDHLARYRLADLFLDTHPYNAHTTAADALLAGLPVVTYCGRAFPARVAASLLRAAGIPGLIARSLDEYEMLALQLATQPERLAEAKRRLQANRATQPLFDTARFCRHLERVYEELWRAAEGLPPLPAAPAPTRSLDLGCGLEPDNPFHADEVIGIDARPAQGVHIHRADLALEPIPFPDAFFDYVTARDFFEHIPRLIYTPTRRYAFVELMNEIHRVLKPGGLLLAITPAYPHPAAFQDPTHVNIITDLTFPAYFDNNNRWGADYGFTGAFIIEKQEWQGQHLLTVMRKAD